jgi:hypothetical protein
MLSVLRKIKNFKATNLMCGTYSVFSNTRFLNKIHYDPVYLPYTTAYASASILQYINNIGLMHTDG